MKEIMKRDGTPVLFDGEKIRIAVRKANSEVEESFQLKGKDLETLVKQVYDSIGETIFNVEDVQNYVLDYMEGWNYHTLRDIYANYRDKRAFLRDHKNTTDDPIESLLTLTNKENENANKDAVLVSTQGDLIAGEVSKDIARRKMIPQNIIKAHDEGIIHIHDMDYLARKMYNCFSGNEEFVTNYGARKFNSFTSGDKVEVVDSEGIWREATVINYGKQEMNEVLLASGTSKKTILTTPNHRWILKNGEVTENLKIGDRLLLLNEQDLGSGEINSELFSLGMIIGDGTDYHNKGDQEGVRIRLIGSKIDYAHYLISAGFSIHQEKTGTYGKHGVAYKQDFLSSRGWREYSREECRDLFLGYYAMDGSKDRNLISTADERVLEMILDISCTAGYYVSSVKTEVRDTNYKKGATLHTVRFRKRTPSNRNWIVKNIMKTGVAEDAWCVEEPVTKTFTLNGGVVTGNCCLVNLEDMLQNGTVINKKMIEKPKSFKTACTISTQIVAQVASAQFGGQTISLAHISPFVEVSRQKIRDEVRHEFMMNDIGLMASKIESIVEQRLAKEIKDGVQTIQYQLETLSSTNGQAPFVSINMDLNEVKEGSARKDLALVIKEVLNQRIVGVKNENGIYTAPAFPKLLYVLDENNIHKYSEYYWLTELAAKCSTKRLVPDYISAKKMKELKNGNVYPPMGCRSFLTADYKENGEHKFFGRFNQGVTTLNLVDVALSSTKDIEKFWLLIDERMELIKEMQLIRYNHLKGTPAKVAPILWQHGAISRLGAEDVIDDYLLGGYSTSSIGIAGLYECVKYMTGESHTSELGNDFAIKVLDYINDKAKEWKSEYNIDFSVYGTPLESTTYKFAKCLKKRFGEVEGITDKDYITNSYHINVTEKIDAFSKLSKEAIFQDLTPGGAISYVELPDMSKNIEAVIAIIQHMYNTAMYAEINVAADTCLKCNYQGEMLFDDKRRWYCPICKNKDRKQLQITRRVCGYIGSNEMNVGRTQDVQDRVKHLGDY